MIPLRTLPLLLATLCGGLAHAECTAPLRAGISELGYSGFRDGTDLRGAAVDVLGEAARRIGCGIELQLFPRSRLFVQFDAGALDIAASAARSAERDRTGVFIPYASSRFDLVAAGPAQFASLAEYIEKSKGTVNAVRGAYYSPAVLAQFERLRQQGRLEEVADFETAFRKIAAGRAAATLAPDMISARLLAGNRLASQVSVSSIAESPPMPVGAYVSLRTVSPATRTALEQAFRAMAADGTLLAIYQSYVGEAVARAITTSSRQVSGKPRTDLPRPGSK